MFNSLAFGVDGLGKLERITRRISSLICVVTSLSEPRSVVLSVPDRDRVPSNPDSMVNAVPRRLFFLLANSKETLTRPPRIWFKRLAQVAIEPFPYNAPRHGTVHPGYMAYFSRTFWIHHVPATCTRTWTGL
jgi:hypothetical protein